VKIREEVPGTIEAAFKPIHHELREIKAMPPRGDGGTVGAGPFGRNAIVHFAAHGALSGPRLGVAAYRQLAVDSTVKATQARKMRGTRLTNATGAVRAGGRAARLRRGGTPIPMC
jgi:hypothetical protein